ncbi:tripartite tricarboxylate transporter substrate binding protein [Fodinicurvata sp. EGI_FJ10296]|uniref:tripartite tricarboxylate transporter substrate binding protein n=1 Tax=Fodinicurvata sp. EGI_FJ10296 TaxID=3231908 RepID=UPI003452E5A7
MNTFKSIIGSVVSATALVAVAGAAQAEYPERDITMVIAYSAGGGTDVMARTMVPYFEEYLGGNVNVTVDNRPGAGGEIGFTALAEAEPDGYTIGMLNIPAFITPLIQRDPAYTLDSYQPIGNVVSDPASIVVRADSDFEDLEDFLTYIEENPGALPIGNSAVGGSMHTSLLRFLTAEGMEVTHVPFPGSAPSRTALLGGHVAASVMGLGEAGPYHLEGDLRILATMAADRWEEVPDVPTFRELGYDIVSGSDRGMAAPAGIPDEITEVLVEALRQTVEDPEFREEAREQVLPLSYMAPDDYKAHMESTLTQMQEVWEVAPWAD